MNFESQTLNDKVRVKLFLKSHYRILKQPVRDDVPETNSNESLILAQNQRWRRASDMQVERESPLRGASRVAHG